MCNRTRVFKRRDTASRRIYIEAFTDFGPKRIIQKSSTCRDISRGGGGGGRVLRKRVVDTLGTANERVARR